MNLKRLICKHKKQNKAKPPTKTTDPKQNPPQNV